MEALTSEPSDNELVSRHVTSTEILKKVICSNCAMMLWSWRGTAFLHISFI